MMIFHMLNDDLPRQMMIFHMLNDDLPRQMMIFHMLNDDLPRQMMIFHMLNDDLPRQMMIFVFSPIRNHGVLAHVAPAVGIFFTTNQAIALGVPPHRASSWV